VKYAEMTNDILAKYNVNFMAIHTTRCFQRMGTSRCVCDALGTFQKAFFSSKGPVSSWPEFSDNSLLITVHLGHIMRRLRKCLKTCTHSGTYV